MWPAALAVCILAVPADPSRPRGGVFGYGVGGRTVIVAGAVFTAAGLAAVAWVW
jgi:hypothetical protein